ncbi:ribosomal biogenesis factor isoform X1 [Microtus pennsylvanicus]|uniref:ribosomal biogenesis factor isoform X1 n=1 Tax=Microtus pennsylvanicus TaxID=10058 RepID=UPI003F6BBB37
MAKNKLKGQKSRNVFHIASQKTFKAKNKAKPVTTNLKKINMNDEKVNRMNRAFVNIQKELASFSKSLSLKSVQKELNLRLAMDGDRDRDPHRTTGLSSQGPVEEQKEGEDEQ